jgi:hypothetical protein
MDDDGGRWRVLQLEATDTAPLASRDGHHQVVPIHHHRGPGWAGQLGVSALVFERPGYWSAAHLHTRVTRAMPDRLHPLPCLHPAYQLHSIVTAH